MGHIYICKKKIDLNNSVLVYTSSDHKSVTFIVEMEESTEPQGKNKVNVVLCGKSHKYELQKFLGEGTFGKVVQCKMVASNDYVAVKILKKDNLDSFFKEVAIHEKIRELDEDKNNIVKFIESFTFARYYCLVFEILDFSLFDLMKERDFTPLCLSQIRIVTQQMLVALNALKSIEVVHADIKPDNIMLVNHATMPFKVKLIDFGLAFDVSKVKLGWKCQAVGYRAPEVILGLPLDESIDMWSLGCMTVFLYLGRHPFPLHCEYESIRVIINLQGQPNNDILNSGIYSRNFFKIDPTDLSWRLKTRQEYNLSEDCKIKPSKHIYDKLSSLDDIVTSCPDDMDDLECRDTQAFVSLLKRMLHVTSSMRLIPSKALGHRFITMKHLNCDASNNYLRSNNMIIENSKFEQSSVNFNQYVTSSEGLSMTEETSHLNNPPLVDEKMSDSSQSASYVEVHARRKWLKRVQNFFITSYRSLGCQKNYVVE